MTRYFETRAQTNSMLHEAWMLSDSPPAAVSEHDTIVHKSFGEGRAAKMLQILQTSRYTCPWPCSLAQG